MRRTPALFASLEFASLEFASLETEKPLEDAAMPAGAKAPPFHAFHHHLAGAGAAPRKSGAGPAAGRWEGGDYASTAIWAGNGFEWRFGRHAFTRSNARSHESRLNERGSKAMVAGGSKAVLVVGILIGAAVLGGLIGAGVDFAAGNQGWWGVGGLIGLMAAAIIDSRIVGDSRRPHR
jgi:hypothetical protein